MVTAKDRSHQNPNVGTRDAQCIFCKIIDGTVASDILFDGGDTLFFKDIHPKARSHIVGVPKKHLPSIATMVGDDHVLIGKLLHDAAHVAREEGIEDEGYRVISNVGKNAGQEVQHLHIHILGGEPLGPLVCTR